jgi:hypothetical protein
MVRYWKAAIIQAIILPLLAIGIIYGLQKASKADNGKEVAADNTVYTWKMDGIHQCKVKREGREEKEERRKKKEKGCG